MLHADTLCQRYTLHLRTQTLSETVEEYAAEIRRLAEVCEFGSEKESRIRDYVLFGLINKQISVPIIKRGGDPQLNEIISLLVQLEGQINVNVIPSVQPKTEPNHDTDTKVWIDLNEEQDENIKEELKDEGVSDAEVRSTQHSDTDDDSTWEEPSIETFDDKSARPDIQEKTASRTKQSKSGPRVYKNPKICTQCNKTFRTPSLLQVHLKYTDPEHKAVTCPTCLKVYFVEKSLQNHIRVHHREILPNYVLPASFVCKHCTKHFSNSADRDIHYATHQGKCQNMCKQCKKIFRCRSLLQVHLKYSDPEHRSLSCPTCQKEFTVESSLNNHIRLHHPETLPGFVKREYECYLCSRKFLHDTSLRGHMVNSHLRSRPKKDLCPQCGKCFTSGRKLNLHLMRADHQTSNTVDVKNFECEYCSKRFAQRSSLLDHVSIHTGERRHECFCGKRFASRTNLYTHRFTHEKEKRLQCHLCDYKCDIPRTLRKHLKIHAVGE